VPPFQPKDCLTPEGRLDGAVLWPRLAPTKVEQKIQVWLTQAYAQLDDALADVDPAPDPDLLNEPARWWVYYRALDEVYKRKLINPSTVTLANEGSQSMLLTQIQDIKNEALEALAAYESFVDDLLAPPDVDVQPIQAQSAMVATTYRW
jgi:hypothetical protein